MSAPPFLEASVIVAAHPDDELLWFASILRHVERVVLVYEDYWPDPRMGDARRAALDAHPHPGVSSLGLSEAATYGCADWNRPVPTEYGMALGHRTSLRNAKQAARRLLGRGSAPREGVQRRYRANFDAIVSRLRPMLRPGANVFTHNPWGEYGHEDHVQLFRALDLLREEIGFTLWMSNYCTERTLPFALTYFDERDHDWIALPTDRDYAEDVADVYRRAGCWTWSDTWNWFRTECFMEAPRAQVYAQNTANLLPLNMFNIASVAKS